MLGGQVLKNIGRVNSDGTVDLSFSGVQMGGQFGSFVGCMAVQPDGKILVGGNFDVLNGQSRVSLGRLNADGTLDESFKGGIGPYGGTYIYCLAVQPDGKVLVGGEFNTLDGKSHINITWVPVQTVRLGLAPFPFTDTQTANFVQRFYRVSSQ